MVAKSLMMAVVLFAGSPEAAFAQSDAMIALTKGDMASADQAMIASATPSVRQADSAVRSSKPQIAPPKSKAPTELLVSYSDRKRRARIELGALGGGRADAPGLIHVGLGMNF